MKENDNVYQNLKGLFWSAFIGIVSFQILAPAVWGYLHKLIGIGYATAYWVFIVFYISFVPVLAVVWLIKDRPLILKYFPPVNDSENVDPPFKIFLTGVVSYIIFLTVITWILLPNPTSYFWFKFLQIFNTLFCLTILLCGAYITYQALIKDVDKKTGRTLRNNYWQLISFCFVFYIVLVLIGGAYFFKVGSTNLLTSNERSSGDNGFQLIKLKEKFDSTERKVQNLVDSLKLFTLKDSIRILVPEKKELSKIDSEALKKYDETVKKGLATFYDSFSNYGETTLFILDNIKKDSPVYPSCCKLATTIEKWEPGDSTITSFISYPKSPRLKAGDLQKPDTLPRTSPTNLLLNQFTGKLSLYLNGLEKQIDNTAKEQLGKQLRDTQVKGMFMFMELFIALLALYLFLKITERTLQQKLEDLQQNKRIRMARRNDKTNYVALENKLIEAETNLEESTNLSGNAWLFVTLIVWLLIPFFKPVEDDKINTDNPFKMLTASGNPPDFLGDGKHPDNSTRGTNYYTRDTINEYTINVDSIVLPGSNTTTITFPEDLRIKLNRIDSIAKIEDALIKIIKNKVNHIEPDTLKLH